MKFDRPKISSSLNIVKLSFKIKNYFIISKNGPNSSEPLVFVPFKIYLAILNEYSLFSKHK